MSKRLTSFVVMLAAVLLALPAQAALYNWADTPEYVSTSGLLPNKRFVNAQQLTPRVQLQATGVQHPDKRAQASRRALVTPPEGAEAVTYYTTGGTLYLSNGSDFVDYTSQVTSIQVIVSGSEIYIAGLSYFASNAWIKGTIDGTTATFPSGQQVDEDATYPEYIVGSSDGQTVSDIVFAFDQTAGTLTAETMFIIESAESNSVAPYGYWLMPVFSLTEPAAPEVVVAPEGAEFKEYALSGTDYSGNAYSSTAFIAIVDNDVYLKGYSQYMPDALIKGVKDGNTVTFPADQYLGTYSGYDSYFMATADGGSDAVFTYYADADTYTATGSVFSILGHQYIDVWVTNPVLTGVVEKAAMPANPSITELKYSSSYGYYINFNVPNVDINGDALASAKLSYQLFVDVEKAVSALTFTPTTHSRLTEEISVFPFGFTENYDIYAGQIYLNDLYSDTWNKIGIKSIYTGGGETNETEIQWYTIKNYAIDDLTAEISAAETLVADETYAAGQATLQAAIDAAKAVAESTESTTEQIQEALTTLKAAEAEFKALNTAYNKLAAEVEAATALKESGTYGKDALNQAINRANRALKNATTSETLTEALTALQAAEQTFLEVNGFASVTWDASKQGYTNAQVIESAQLSADFTMTLAQGEASYAPAYYTSGSAVRVYYKNSFTITASENVKTMTKIVITQSGTSYGTELTASVGELTKSGSTLTWVGDATEVTFTNFKEGGTNTQTRIRTITISYQGQPDEQVTLPDNASAETWTIEGVWKTSWSNAEVQRATEVAFVGEDEIYVKGLNNDNADFWVKGTIAEGKATFPAQLNGDMPEYGEKYYMLGSADGETICDVVFTYDADAKTLTQETPYIYVNYMYKDRINQEYLAWWEQAKLYVGEPKVDIAVEAPEGLATDGWNFASTLNEEAYTYKVQAGFDGDDVYFQGIIPNSDKLYIKATKNAEGQYVVPALQFAGQGGSFWAPRKYYVAATDADGNFVDVVFGYDAVNEVFTTAQDIVINIGKLSQNPAFTFTGGASIAKVRPVIVDELPYSNSFATVEEQDAFQIIDANGDNSTWSFEDSRVKYGYNGINAADDWLVGPAIKLEAGKFYKFSIDAWRSSTSGTEAFEVKLASEATAEALSAGALVIVRQNVEPIEAASYANNCFVVAETGYYYVGIHCTSPADQYGMYVTNFNIEETVEMAFDYEKISINPAEGKVDELYNFVISFGGQVVTVNEDALLNLTKTGTDEVVAEAGIELLADGTVSVGLDDHITAAGKYTLNIPENAIFFNGKALDPLAFKYQVGDLPDYTIDPAPGLVEKLSTFTITFNNYMVDLNEEEAGVILFNTETETEVEGSIYVIGGGTQAYISLNQEVTAPGSYELIIMDASFKKTIDDSFLPELSFAYTIAISDGINGVKADDFSNKTVYNLKGQRVETPAKGGLYIVNGKKVVVK